MAISCSALINDYTIAQVSENTLKSITNHTSLNAITKAQIKVGVYPIFIEVVRFGHIGDYIYVANLGSNTVSVIDHNNNTVIKTITVGPNPRFIEKLGDYIYVANSGSNTVSVIDPNKNNTVIKHLAVGDSPVYIKGYNNTVYVANYDSNTVSVIDPNKNNTVIKNITVGKSPSFIETVGIGITGDYIYVANLGSNTVSVIDPNKNNTVIKNITVGKSPSFMTSWGNIYVANSGSNTVSVINATTNTVIKNITTVGINPSFIKKVGFGGYIYVSNSGTNISSSNTVSVIDSNKNTVIKNITVGKSPSYINTAGSDDAAYVSNSGSNTVSLVDPVTNEEIAGMKFDIKPFGAGRIICNELDTPVNRFLYVTSGAKCVAKPTTGFEFSSWSQNLPRNTNITVSAAKPSDWLRYPLTSLNEAFTDDPGATLTVNRFGNFTAYFKALPSPLPPEFTASLITTIVAALAGSLLIPVALSSYKSKKQISILNAFRMDMVTINKDGLDEKDISKLNILNQVISDFYAAGKITNEQYTNLKNEVYLAFQEIFKKRIEAIKEQDLEAINKTRNDIIDAYNNGKLGSEYYTDLKNEISNTYQKIFKERIESNTEDVNNIKNDIEAAYSNRKLTELDYNLLLDKISHMADKKSDTK
jgi:YVTN family beta-propeller protein